MDPRLLADAGGWTVVIVMMSFLGTGFVKGWIVPGFVYRREVARGDKADDQADQNSRAIEKLVTLLDAGGWDDDRRGR